MTYTNFNLALNQEFIKTSEFFALNGAQGKTVMPLPHVTLRKKEYKDGDVRNSTIMDERESMSSSRYSNFRRSVN